MRSLDSRHIKSSTPPLSSLPLTSVAVRPHSSTTKKHSRALDSPLIPKYPLAPSISSSFGADHQPVPLVWCSGLECRVFSWGAVKWHGSCVEWQKPRRTQVSGSCLVWVRACVCIFECASAHVWVSKPPLLRKRLGMQLPGSQGRNIWKEVGPHFLSIFQCSCFNTGAGWYSIIGYHSLNITVTYQKAYIPPPSPNIFSSIAISRWTSLYEKEEEVLPLLLGGSIPSTHHTQHIFEVM